MMPTILIPLDGSPQAEEGIPCAVAIARRTGAQLLLVRAVLTAGSIGSEAADLDRALVADAQKYLTNMVQDPQVRGLRTSSLICEDEAAAAIVGAADKRADLIVMSAHGRTALDQVAYGTVAAEVLRRSPVPVLLVPRDTSSTWADSVPLRLVVALDGSEAAEQAIIPARELAQALDMELVLVRAVEPRPAFRPGLMIPVPVSADPHILEIEIEDAEASSLAEAQTYLECWAAILQESWLRTRIFVAEGEPASVIREAIHEHRAHGVVLTSHSGSGATEIGSVARTVLASSYVPVMVIPTPAEEMDLSETDHVTIVPNGEPDRALVFTLSEDEADLASLALRTLIDGRRSGSSLKNLIAVLTRLEQIREQGRGLGFDENLVRAS